jgi:hypothetical protein
MVIVRASQSRNTSSYNALDARRALMLDLQDIRVTSYLPQSGYGHGGMTVGLSLSGIIVHHLPTGLGVSCDSERSQHANKEKAIALLEALLLAIESEKHYTPIPPPTPYVTGKVMAIKNVRERTGCGLKEAKEAIDHVLDLYPNMDIKVAEEFAIPYVKTSTRDNLGGECRMGDNCLCGGDVPAIREGCFEWIWRYT